MKRMIGLFVGALCLLLFIGPICDSTNKLSPPTLDKVDITDIIGLSPKIMDYEEYAKQDYEDQRKYSGMWSTLNQINLDSLKTSVIASSTLKGYNATNLIDKKVETAWVEGVLGDGIGEWFSIKLDAEKDSEGATPFTISQFCMVPGYAKSQKTWEENNRVKTAVLTIYSPKVLASEYEYIAFRLNFEDINKLQVFQLPYDLIIPNYPMSKTVWLVIEDVYKGTKYSDTCISEVVIQGGCLP